MTGKIPQKFESKIQNIPTHLQFAASHKSMKYAELLSAVDLMDKQKCISFDQNEYYTTYGKNAISGIKLIAKKTNFPWHLRVVIDGNNILIFKNDKMPAK